MDRGYIICATPRSGSNFLCDLLDSTNVLGHPKEYFNAGAGRDFGGPDYPEDPKAQFEVAQRMASTANGVYGLKIFATRFQETIACGWVERLPVLSFVFLRRRDLLGQAISLACALQTGRWNSFEQQSGQTDFDFGRIANRLRSLAEHEAHWRFYFARNGLSPLELIYEDVIADPEGAIAQFAALMRLGTVPEVDPSSSRFGIQRDEISEEWRARYLAQARNLGVFP